MSPSGGATRKVADAIEHETARLVEIGKKITESEAKISAYEDLIRILPKDQNFKLREGTEIAKVEKHIRAAGRAVSLDDIVKALAQAGDDLTKKKKSLRGTIRAYVRDGKVFDHGTEPDTFTLIEFKCVTNGPNGDTNHEKN